MFPWFTDPGGLSVLWSLAAFGICGVVFWLGRRNGPVLISAWVTIAIFAAAGLLPVIGYFRTMSPYRIHVTVVGPGGVLAEQARVWSSLESESKKVAEGWELDVPAWRLPADRTVLIWAALEAGDTSNSKAVLLRADHDPSVTIRITGDRSATVAGKITNREGKPINSAVVSRSDRGEDSIFTQNLGDFELPVDTQDGDDVKIKISAAGYQLRDMWVTAGDRALDVVLDRLQADSVK